MTEDRTHFQNVSESSTEFQKDQESFAVFQRVSEDFRRVLECSREFHSVPESSREFQWCSGGPDSLPAHTSVIVRVQDVNDNSPQIKVNTLTSSNFAEVHLLLIPSYLLTVLIRLPRSLLITLCIVNRKQLTKLVSDYVRI